MRLVMIREDVFAFALIIIMACCWGSICLSFWEFVVKPKMRGADE